MQNAGIAFYIIKTDTHKSHLTRLEGLRDCCELPQRGMGPYSRHRSLWVILQLNYKLWHIISRILLNYYHRVPKSCNTTKLINSVYNYATHFPHHHPTPKIFCWLCTNPMTCPSLNWKPGPMPSGGYANEEHRKIYKYIQALGK